MLTFEKGSIILSNKTENSPLVIILSKLKSDKLKLVQTSKYSDSFEKDFSFIFVNPI